MQGRKNPSLDFTPPVEGAPLTFDPLLHERNFGDIRGTPYASLGFDMFAPDYAPPNGETWEVFHTRVDRAWALGPLTKGRYWEITAVPDIRGQVAAVAEDIAKELSDAVQS